LKARSHLSGELVVSWVPLAVVTGLVVISDAAADASPWPLGEGQRLSIASLVREDTDSGQNWRYGLYSEAGLNEHWTFVTDFQVQVPDRTDQPVRQFGTIGVKRSFEAMGPLKWALQASYLDGEAVQIQACEGPGAELQLSVGLSGQKAYGRPGFAVAKLGGQAREGACERLKLDLTAGLDLTDRWSLIGEVWMLRGTDAVSDKLQASVVRRMGKRWRLQLAARAELSGRFEERGLLIGIWAPW
jgi:hypothetical protein